MDLRTSSSGMASTTRQLCSSSTRALAPRGQPARSRSRSRSSSSAYRLACNAEAGGSSPSPSLATTADATTTADAAGADEQFDPRAFRRSLNQSGRYVRKTVNDKDSLELMEDHGVGYSSTGLVAQMRTGGFSWRHGNTTLLLAEAYGFCWGVERAVQMAYEAKRAYPGRRLHITNEIIHNPGVNQRLKEMDVQFIEADAASGDKDFSAVKQGDVVILPAFGASVHEMRMLYDKEVQIVDTTCPWVAKVWNAVDSQAKKGHTSIIHGQWSHEETVATASFAGTYVVVRTLDEARYVCDYILNGGDRAEFLAKFENAMSPGFDPESDLERVGMANQTTMLKDETQAIGKLLERTMLRKYGPAELSEHFMVMDTICDATQERQDAMYGLVDHQDDAEKAIDLLLVVGGFNSSNTSHLQEIGELKGVPSYWIDSAARIDVPGNRVTHKTAHGELVETKGWLPLEGPLRVGVTSGASTPDRAVEDALDALLRTRDPSFKGVVPLAEAAAKPPVQH